MGLVWDEFDLGWVWSGMSLLWDEYDLGWVVAESIVHAKFKGIKTNLNYLTLACAQIMLKMTVFKSQIRFLYFFFPRQKSKPANIINVATETDQSEQGFLHLSISGLNFQAMKE